MCKLTLTDDVVFVGIMQQFDHPNIIKLLGVCPSSPVSIVMELAEFGEVCVYAPFIFASQLAARLFDGQFIYVWVVFIGY